MAKSRSKYNFKRTKTVKQILSPTEEFEVKVLSMGTHKTDIEVYGIQYPIRTPLDFVEKKVKPGDTLLCYKTLFGKRQNKLRLIVKERVHNDNN